MSRRAKIYLIALVIAVGRYHLGADSRSLARAQLRAGINDHRSTSGRNRTHHGHAVLRLV